MASVFPTGRMQESDNSRVRMLSFDLAGTHILNQHLKPFLRITCHFSKGTLSVRISTPFSIRVASVDEKEYFEQRPRSLLFLRAISVSRSETSVPPCDCRTLKTRGTSTELVSEKASYSRITENKTIRPLTCALSKSIGSLLMLCEGYGDRRVKRKHGEAPRLFSCQRPTPIIHGCESVSPKSDVF